MYALLCLIDAVVVLLSITPPAVSHLPPAPSFTPTYFGDQIVLHIVTGFLVGATSLNLSKALIGAGLGPLIDIDHVGALLGLPVNARAAHSFVVLAILILVVWGLSLWRWGAADFALFASLQFSAHFLVAPPGFPLFSPISATVYSFPNLVWAPLTLALVVIYFLKCRRDSARVETG